MEQRLRNNDFFTFEENAEIAVLMSRLRAALGEAVGDADMHEAKGFVKKAIDAGLVHRDVFGLNPLVTCLRAALITVEEMGMRRAAVMSLLVYEAVRCGAVSLEDVERALGEDVSRIVGGLVKVGQLYAKNPAIETENFRSLLLSFADDMRVILIMIAERVAIMRNIKDADAADARIKAASEAAYLYAPLAHKLGLYKLKSELEDLSLKYLETDVYYQIKEKLNETKASRDLYIEKFIRPIDERLRAAGLKYHIKGRTKSIHSIWQKMKKQRCAFEGIYDLFAIRVILDSEPDREKQECWQAYSLVTDMYTPNPNRLRDWISCPKSNGYESLHTTVMGPEGKWVEVQIRTERMDDIAEHGMAAHWRYKGIRSAAGLDEWLAGIREALESSDDGDRELMDRFKMDLYKDDVFVFTPKGDLYKLPHGATVLDFAFSVHTNLGCHCTGAKVNGRHVQLRYVLANGDQVEITSSATQQPKQGWLDIVTTSRARTKIRQALKEQEARQAAVAKEELLRKMKNRKIEFDEGTMNRLVKRMGGKQLHEFYQAVAEGEIRVDDVIERYLQQWNLEHGITDASVSTPAGAAAPHTAATFQLRTDALGCPAGSSRDVLVIDRGMVGLDFSMARCCNPIYGDNVFGFVTVNGGIKIHRTSCPNAADLRRRFGYRIVEARWAGKAEGNLYPITLSIVGNDDIGIVNNITTVIAKDEHIQMRSISIDSHDRLFSGTLTILIDDTGRLESLMKKLRTVKGVRQVNRM